MRIKKIERLIVKYHEQIVGTLSLTPDNKQCAFEYDKAWLSNGFSISPLELPLKPGLFIAKPSPFYGNFGVFEDSLPDGYGRYLLHKALLKEGINDTQLSALDRLSLVGNGGMGALTYEPETSIGTSHEPLDFDLLQEKALEVLHEKNDDDVELLLFNSRNSGGCRPKALFSNNEGHWMVKFRHTYDPQDMGLIEFHYNELARQCGIRVPDFKLINGKYFTTRRFDISQDGERLHTVTAGGLLNIPLSNPILDFVVWFSTISQTTKMIIARISVSQYRKVIPAHGNGILLPPTISPYAQRVIMVNMRLRSMEPDIPPFRT